MAKDKSKSKGKKKFKALEKGVGKGAKAVLENVAPRVESFLQPDREKEQAKEPEVKPVVEQPKVEPQIVEPIVEEKPAVEEAPAPLETPADDVLYELADLFKSFADATRLRILFALLDGGKCVADISEAAGVSQSATSHQLRSMKQSNLVKFTRDGKQVIYSLANENVQAMLAQGLSVIGE